MINAQFVLNGTTLDYDDDIGAVAMDMWADDPCREDEDTPADVAIYLPHGESLSVTEYLGRTAGEDAEVERDDYQLLPVSCATLGRA